MDFQEFFLLSESYDYALNEAREKVVLSDDAMDMSVDDLMQAYNIKSKTTAWRAKKNGFFTPGYHDKEVVLSKQKIDPDVILSSAKKGVAAQLGSLMARAGWSKNVNSFVAPLTMDDYVQNAAMRLLELGGHIDFSNDGFRVNIAKNATRDFFYANLKHSKRQKDIEVL